MKKKIVLIWDFDGPIGQVNATLPYKFSHDVMIEELVQVRYALKKLKEFNVKSCFAITGFSAERGMEPFNFPALINDIQEHGHEIASHSWKHEWTPLFSEKQIRLSFQRSKVALEQRQNVIGFVPPHNKPATWVRRGAYSLEDRGLWPLFKMGDLDNVFNLLRSTGYKWMRIAHNPLKYKLGISKRSNTGRIYTYRGLLILENHYTGFDKKVCDIIESSDNEHYIISAHPAMLAKDESKKESSIHFEAFLEQFSNRMDIEFVKPIDLI